MADKIEPSQGSAFRDYRGTQGAVEDAQGRSASDERQRGQRGRRGASMAASPRPAVRDPGPAHEGESGEPAYGAPTSPPPVAKTESEKRKTAKPDPLKAKPKDAVDNDDDDDEGNPY